MALFKRGNIWWMEITDPSTGKKLRETTRSTDRLIAEKLQELRRMQLASSASPYPLDGRSKVGRTWKEAAARWLSEHDDKRSARDDRRYAEWWSSKLGNARLNQLDSNLLRGLLEEKKRQTSGSTANRYLSFISAVLNAAVKEFGWMPSKPHLRRYREPKGVVRYLTSGEIDRLLVRYLTSGEIDRLLAELPPHQRDMAEFALSTGLRQGAVRKLTWDAVQLDKGICWVTPENSKSGEAIGVPLNDAAVAVLRRCIGQHERFVFTYRGNPILNVNSIAWKRGLRRAGIKNFRWHDLRHTWASHHAMNGTPIHVLQELGGWHDMQMVKRYAHMSADSLSRFAGNAAVAGVQGKVAGKELVCG